MSEPHRFIISPSPYVDEEYTRHEDQQGNELIYLGDAEPWQATRKRDNETEWFASLETAIAWIDEPAPLPPKEAREQIALRAIREHLTQGNRAEIIRIARRWLGRTKALLVSRAALLLSQFAGALSACLDQWIM